MNYSYPNIGANLLEKIYITGCGGMLGDAFFKEFRDEYELKCTDIDVLEIGFGSLPKSSLMGSYVYCTDEFSRVMKHGDDS